MERHGMRVTMSAALRRVVQAVQVARETEDPALRDALRASLKQRLIDQQTTWGS